MLYTKCYLAASSAVCACANYVTNPEALLLESPPLPHWYIPRYIYIGTCAQCTRNGEGHVTVMASADTQRRVKVYSFNEKMQWEDMGTGHVSVNFVERLHPLIIVVRSEEDGKL